MASRQFYYAESLSESTTTSTTYGDKVSLTFTPDASSDYLIIWSASVKNNTNAADDVKVRLQDDTAAATLGEFNIEVKDITATGDYQSVGGIEQLTFGASPSSQTVSIEFASEVGTSTTAIRSATITAIKFHADDEYAEADSETSTNSSTFQDKTTLTFTPATQGDYLIISTAEWQDNASSNGGQYQLLDSGSTSRGLTERFPKDTSNYMPWNTMIRQNLTASSKTFKIQFKNNSGAAPGQDIRRARIFALRLDTLDANFYAESLTRTETTSTTYVDKVTLTDTPAAANQLRLAVGIKDGTTTNQSHYFNFDQGGSSIYEVFYEPALGSGFNGDSVPVFTCTKYTGSGSSTTWKTQHKGEASTSNSGLGSSAISILKLGSSDVTGTIANTLDATTSSITGHTTSGTIAVTLAGATSSITALETYSGSLATTLGGATASFTGTVPFIGALSTTLADATSSISALETYTGTLGTTLAAATSAFSGNVDTDTTGALATTLDAFTSSIAGLETYTGALATTLGATVSNISASLTFTGSISTTLGVATASMAGSLTFAGSLATTLGNATPAFSGALTFTGSLTTTLQDATMAATGSVPFIGTIATTLDNFTMSASGNNSSGAGAGASTPYHPIYRPRRR